MIGYLLAELLPWVIGGATVILALFGYGRAKKHEGRKETYIEMKAKDHEAASELRDRVDLNLDDRVRQFDDAGYRD